MFLNISEFSQENTFNKAVGLETCNFTKNRLRHRCFPVKLAKYLAKSFFK